jgi:PAS domain-containing protein
VLPVRNVLALGDKAAPAEAAHAGPIPSWVQDYALYLLDIEGRIATWYSGAARIYGYSAEEVLGQHVSFLYPGDDTLQGRLQEEFNRATTEGHMGTEGWQSRKDGPQYCSQYCKDAGNTMEISCNCGHAGCSND